MRPTDPLELLAGAAAPKPASVTRRGRGGRPVDEPLLVDLLTPATILQARVRAAAKTRDLTGGERCTPGMVEEVTNEQRALEMLALCLRDPAHPDKPWKTADDIAELSEAEVSRLRQVVNRLHAEHSPNAIGATELDRWIEDVAAVEENDFLSYMRVAHAEGLFYAYGRGAFELTAGQVVLYAARLRSLEKLRKERGTE